MQDLAAVCSQWCHSGVDLWIRWQEKMTSSSEDNYRLGLGLTSPFFTLKQLFRCWIGLVTSLSGCCTLPVYSNEASHVITEVSRLKQDTTDKPVAQLNVGHFYFSLVREKFNPLEDTNLELKEPHFFFPSRNWLIFMPTKSTLYFICAWGWRPRNVKQLARAMSRNTSPLHCNSAVFYYIQIFQIFLGLLVFLSSLHAMQYLVAIVITADWESGRGRQRCASWLK